MDIDNFIKLLRQFEIVPWEARRYPRKKKKTLFVLLLASLSPKILHQKYRFGLDSLL